MSGPLCVYCSRRHPEDIRVEAGIRIVSCPNHPPEGFSLMSPGEPLVRPLDPSTDLVRTVDPARAAGMRLTADPEDEARIAALEARLASAEVIVAAVEYVLLNEVPECLFCSRIKGGGHVPACPIGKHREAYPSEPGS